MKLPRWHQTALLLIVAGALPACSRPHEFGISSDEPMQDIDISLRNVRRAEVRFDRPTFAWATVHTGDSSGEIRVELVGGEQVSCKIGHLTSGDLEPHALIIDEGTCREAFQE